MSMENVPTTLDIAVVLLVAKAKNDLWGHSYETGEKMPICYFAIAQYEGDKSAYLFGVTASHEVVCDFLHESVLEAEQSASLSGFVCQDFTPFSRCSE